MACTIIPRAAGPHGDRDDAARESAVEVTRPWSDAEVAELFARLSAAAREG